MNEALRELQALGLPYAFSNCPLRFSMHGRALLALAIMYFSDNFLPLPNITSPAGPAATTCVYTVSGQYSLLARVLYYALLIFTVFTHKSI
jgi:hypothetical protein